MFTGIIEELGTIDAVETRAAGARLSIRCSTVISDATEGASIAVNGVCLTAIDLHPGSAVRAGSRASTWSARSPPPAASAATSCRAT